jgi:hypothetical protein
MELHNLYSSADLIRVIIRRDQTGPTTLMHWQGCTNPRCHFVRVTDFCMVHLIFVGPLHMSPIWNLAFKLDS